VNVMLLLSAVYLSFVAVTVAILGCTSPFPEIYYSAADKRICPDKKNPEKKTLYFTDGKGQYIPTHCEAVILSAAIDHCLDVTRKSLIGNFALGGSCRRIRGSHFE